MTPQQKRFFGYIEMTRELPEEVSVALESLQDESLSKDEVESLTAALLEAPQHEAATLYVGGVIRG